MADAQVAEAGLMHAAADAERVLQCEQVSYWLLGYDAACVETSTSASLMLLRPCAS